MTITQNTVQLPVAPQSAARARHFVRKQTRLGSAERAAADLLVTELVGNAVKHATAAEALEVRIDEPGRTQRISVSHPHHRELEEPDPGSGFKLLSHFARDWGHRFEDSTLDVWFELRAPGAVSMRSKSSDDELFARMSEDPEHATEELLERHRDLAFSIARRYRGKGLAESDLRQVALVALLKAIRRFEPDKGNLRSYASVTISGEMKKLLRDRGWSMRVPRSIQERSLAVARAMEELTQRLGRSPEPGDIARHLDLSVEEVVEAMEARAAYSSVSMDEASPDEGQTLAETLGSRDQRLEIAHDRADLDTAMARLPKRQRHIVSLRFDQDMTQSEIGEVVGISQMHVSRLLNRAVETLREELDELGVPETG